MEEDNPIITEPFYLKKFMEIQRINVILYNQLRLIHKDEEIRQLIIERFGPETFKILDLLPT